MTRPPYCTHRPAAPGRPAAGWNRRPAPGLWARLGVVSVVAMAAWLGAAPAWADGGAASPASAARAVEATPTLPVPVLAPCRLKGYEHEAVCGQVQRPLDPGAPGGARIAVHFAVLPALARNKKPDPVFFFAGGPGQSAIGLAGVVARQSARLLNRRDIVLVDQRGTGRSAPLPCAADDPSRPLREWIDPERQLAELQRCREALQKLPHGDLRQYTTSIAMADVDAVRQVLGAAQVNLVGGSYGTRAALEYQRQFPAAVRRIVIDGVAPPDMVLPAAFSLDNQAALDALFGACEADAGCQGRHPQLRARWRALLQGLPREVSARHPLTGRAETVTLTRETLLGLVRVPLYVPALAAALPAALQQAMEGRLDALLGLAMAMGGGRDAATRLAGGMHFSVICAEDGPRMAQAADEPGADFGDTFAALYRKTCASWPLGRVPPDFYRLEPSRVPALVLSGGIDPVTPPRHGARVTQALGTKARHVVVPHAGHGVMSLGCMPDVLYRFIDAADEAEALAVDARCAQGIPRPPVFVPVEAAAAAPLEVRP